MIFHNTLYFLGCWQTILLKNLTLMIQKITGLFCFVLFLLFCFVLFCFVLFCFVHLSLNRDLSKPIGALNPERLKDYVQRYRFLFFYSFYLLFSSNSKHFFFFFFITVTWKGEG